MFILKTVIRLGTFFFTFILMGMQAWSQNKDKVNSYKLTQDVDHFSRKLVVTTRQQNNVYLHLAEVENQADVQGPEPQAVQGAAAQEMEDITTETIVTAWLPDPNHSNIYSAVHFPYASERSNNDPGNFYQARWQTGTEAVVPSLNLLEKLSASPWNLHEVTLLLPLPPINVPDLSRTRLVTSYIAQVLISQITFELSGLQCQLVPEDIGRYRSHYAVSGWLRTSSESRRQSAWATFSFNAEDRSVRLETLTISNCAFIERIPSTEDHSQPQNALMDGFWNQLETVLAENKENPLLAVLTASIKTRMQQKIIEATISASQKMLQATVEDLSTPANEEEHESASERPGVNLIAAPYSVMTPAYIPEVSSILDSVITEMSELMQGMPETLRRTINREALTQTFMPELYLSHLENVRGHLLSALQTGEQGSSSTRSLLQVIEHEISRIQSLPPEQEPETVAPEIIHEPELRGTPIPPSGADNSTGSNHSSNVGGDVLAELPDPEDVTNHVYLLPDISSGQK